MLGAALYRILNFLGYKSVGINHLGDYGTQFGKLISAYKRWGDRETVEKGGIRALNELYVRFHREAEEHPEYDDEARAYFKKIEEKDEECLALFRWFKELTLKDVQKIYDLLDVHFDSYAGESFYSDKMGPVVEELKEKGLLVESQGAQVVDLEAYGMPPCIILKSDGTSLYATRDMAAAIYRKKTYDFYKCLYVVAYQQNLHFKQFFKVLELMGKEWAKDLVHVAYGMVSLEEGTMSTRKGNVVFLEDVINRCIEKALAIITEKNPDLENKEEVAQKVGWARSSSARCTTARSRISCFPTTRCSTSTGRRAYMSNTPAPAPIPSWKRAAFPKAGRRSSRTPSNSNSSRRFRRSPKR